MSNAVRFLHALAQALSTLALYSPGHPATRRVVDHALDALKSLIAVNTRPVFLFLGGPPVYAGRALHELGEWPWSRRFARSGIQRIEFDERLTHEGMTQLLEQLMTAMASDVELDRSHAPIEGVVFGGVAVQDQETGADQDDAAASEAQGSQEFQLNLNDELAAVGYVLAQARVGRLARAEAEAVIRIFDMLLEEYALPQAAQGSAAYPVVHATNTALVTMSAATATGLERAPRQRLGLAALLHDVGMAQLPPTLAEQETLSPEERTVVESHTSRGARILLDGGPGLALAAAVAYEHHLRPDGGGYPQGRLRQSPHWASRLVGAASAFVALRSPRPFRAAWTPERAVRALEDGAGTVFDAEVSRLLAVVVRPT